MMRSISKILLVAVWALGPVVAGAQEEPVRTIPFEGIEIVCHVLHYFGMEPIVTLEGDSLKPEETVIVVFGSAVVPPGLDLARARWKAFLDDGGSLLFATDHETRIDGLGVHISGNQIAQPEDVAYRNNVHCPWLTYTQPEHPLFRFLSSGIATNCPSSISGPYRERLNPLLGLAASPRKEPRFFARKGGSAYMVGSPATAPPRGRCLFVAGQGMFMNGMMLQPDNDNFAFTVNAIRWMRESNSGPRRRALFVVDGKIITDFNANLAPPPLPSIPMPNARMLNRLMRGLANELLAGQIEQVSAIFLGLATLGLLLYGAKKVMESRHTHETAVPLLVGPWATPTKTLPLIQQRQQEISAQNNFAEEARFLVREWFQSNLGFPPEGWDDGSAMEWTVKGSRWLPSLLKIQAQRLSRLARSTEPVRVSRGQLAGIARSLLVFQQAIEDGRLVLLVNGKKVRHP